MSLDPQERMWIQNLQTQLDAHTKDIQELRSILNHMREQAIYNAGRAAQGGPVEPPQGEYMPPRFGAGKDEEK